jgi:GH24 family phage-related lysozyme (muramidase)
MKASEGLLNFLKEFERLEQQRYRDQGGKWTIGYGHRIYPGDTVTAVSDIGATEILARDVKSAENAVNNRVTGPLTQNEFDALVSFTFNAGPGALGQSQLLRSLNGGEPIREENFTSWNRVGPNVSNGLTNRRTSEWLMFTTGEYRR